MDSALFFSAGVASDDGADDGALWAWEIVDELELGADVVVLSACSTGRGQTVAGEGVIGLARAFQYAGARTIVAAQWEIPDQSTARLMAGFYEGLGEGLSTAEALQRAQTELASRGGALAHPYHWAAFQVRGDWR
jgi:CHAT domain-containing protein